MRLGADTPTRTQVLAATDRIKLVFSTEQVSIKVHETQPQR